MHNALAFCKGLIARSRFSSLGIVRQGRNDNLAGSNGASAKLTGD